MILNNLLTAITHVVTQLTGKWISPPRCFGRQTERADCAAIDKFDAGGFSAIDSESWLDLLETEASSFFPELAWLESFLHTRKISLSHLADTASQHFEAVADAGGEIISILDPGYPPLLRQIARPPLLLSAIGQSALLQGACVAAIGSRKASYESLRASVEVGLALADSPWTVVSGGAIGCDIAVHEGMLASGVDEVSAVVVFAGGLRIRYPRCNDRAFKEILERGGLFISERLWSQDALPRDFPARNRIVSGMSTAVAVMSAAPKSGSLITANEALEQGRDVYVFDLRSPDARMEGSTQLIHDGASAFHSAEELLGLLSQGYEVVAESSLARSDITCQPASYLGTFNAEQLNSLVF